MWRFIELIKNIITKNAIFILNNKKESIFFFSNPFFCWKIFMWKTVSKIQLFSFSFLCFKKFFYFWNKEKKYCQMSEYFFVGFVVLQKSFFKYKKFLISYNKKFFYWIFYFILFYHKNKKKCFSFKSLTWKKKNSIFRILNEKTI